jgi:hypothetical protein
MRSKMPAAQLPAIDPKDEAYPKAWAAFLRLRKINRDGPLDAHLRCLFGQKATFG